MLFCSVALERVCNAHYNNQANDKSREQGNSCVISVRQYEQDTNITTSMQA
jgi:hypothetical protein